MTSKTKVDSYLGNRRGCPKPLKINPRWTIKERYSALKKHHDKMLEFLWGEVFHLADEVDTKNKEIESLKEEVEILSEERYESSYE